jgi:hypothetical protein
MFPKYLRLALATACLVALCVCYFGCTTVTRTDGTVVRIPAGGVVGSMAATNIACQDNVQALMAENAKLRARIAELEAKASVEQKKSSDLR